MVCENCKTSLKRKKVIVLFSGSVSGSSFTIYLCEKCAKNKRILEKMQHINDCKLALADGEISVDEFNKEIRVLHEEVKKNE